ASLGCQGAAPSPTHPSPMPEYPPLSDKPDGGATRAEGNDGDPVAPHPGTVAVRQRPCKASCKGQNECKGRGNCKTEKTDCKGQNQCKGQGGCRGMDCP